MKGNILWLNILPCIPVIVALCKLSLFTAFLQCHSIVYPKKSPLALISQWLVFVKHHALFSWNGLKYLDIFFIYIIIDLNIKNVDHLYSHMSDLKIHQRQKVYYHVLLLQKSGVLELT